MEWNHMAKCETGPPHPQQRRWTTCNCKNIRYRSVLVGTVSNQEWLHLLLESLTDRIELGHREGCCRPSSASEAFLSAISGRGNIFLLHRLLLPLGLLWLPFRLDRRSQTITISNISFKLRLLARSLPTGVRCWSSWTRRHQSWTWLLPS